MPLPLITFNPLTRIRRERVFPPPARILVRRGQQVEPGDSIAQSVLEPRHLTLDIARSLGLPGEDIERYLQFGVGAAVAEGDILAGPVGYTQRVLRSPVAGKIVRIQEGELILQTAAQPDELTAGLPGEIVELVEGQGAVIELTAALVQGVWGNGRRTVAKYYCLASSPDEQLVLDPADSRLVGAILAGAACRNPDIFKIAQAAGIAGLLLSSLDPSLYESALRTKFPVVLLEGFGSYPLDPTVFELLVALSGQIMALNAMPWDRTTNARPEAIIPCQPQPGEVSPDEPDSESPPALSEVASARTDLGLIQPGQRVRLLGLPHLGNRGRLVDLPGPVKFSNGIEGLGARVRLDNGNEILLPLTNLEFIG